MHTLATAQIHAETLPSGIVFRQRYLRVEQALEYGPWRRAKLYQLIRRGDLKSFVLKEKGALRGMRLIDRDSIDAYLEKQAAAAYAASEKTAPTSAASQEEAA
jgi:hypothetical protein